MKDNRTVDNIYKQLSIAVELTEHIKKIVIFKCKENNIEQERENYQESRTNLVNIEKNNIEQENTFTSKVKNKEKLNNNISRS